MARWRSSLPWACASRDEIGRLLLGTRGRRPPEASSTGHRQRGSRRDHPRGAVKQIIAASSRGRGFRPGAPGTLPVPPTPLIGRSREVRKIVRALQRSETRLLTLTGPAPAVPRSRPGARGVFPRCCRRWGCSRNWCPRPRRAPGASSLACPSWGSPFTLAVLGRVARSAPRRAGHQRGRIEGALRARDESASSR